MPQAIIPHCPEFKDLADSGPLVEHDNCIRIYGGSAMGATIQLRAYASRTRKGVKRRMIATASYINGAKVDQIIAALTEIRKTLP